MKIFSKKKFESERGTHRDWAEKSDGREVKNMYIVGTSYGSPDDWCVDSEPLMERFKAEKIAVRFTEEWQRDTFLKMCEEAGLRWRSGHKPTAYKPHELRRLIASGFFDSDGDDLSCGYYCFQDSEWHIIDYLDFINSAADTKTKQKPENKKYNITITNDGKTTMAVFTVDGKTVKTATAKCNPSDRFDFHAGAELAFDRLFEKQHKALDLHNLKVGDKVRVRKDLHMGVYGNSFAVSSMVGMAGKVVTISTKLANGNYFIVGEAWKWSPEMFENI